ncbi:MAG: hypothetical protein ABH859_05450 [Pseudomonadota bacterium]
MKTLLITLLLCLSTSLAQASAVIIDAKGKISIKTSDKKSVPAQIGQELPDGTQINPEKNSSISIMLSNGTIAEIASGQKYTVGKPGKAKQETTVIQGLALAMNEATATGAQPTVHGMVKMTTLGPGAPEPVVDSAGPGGDLRAEYPLNIALILPEAIDFSWNKDAKIDFPNPVLVIEDEQKKQLLVKNVDQKSSSLKINSHISKFQPGQNYSWYFASQTKGQIQGKTRRFNFSLLSRAAEQKLKSDLREIEKMNISKSGQDFLMAQLYFRAKMYDKMVEKLLPLWEQNKTDLLKKELFLGYHRLGKPSEAAKYQ